MPGHPVASTQADQARLRLGAALAALRKLIADPEDTRQAFAVIRAMAGPSLRRGLRRFRGTAFGRRALAEKPSLLRILGDRQALAALPEHSLGHAYFEFVYGESLSTDGLVEASMNADAQAYAYSDPDLRWYGERMRDQHDLWHIVTQYGRDPFGEVCLLTFTYAQTRNRGVGLIAIGGGWRLCRSLGFGALRAMWQALRAGRRARWLPAQDWEALLRLPVAEVRRQLAVRPPSIYWKVYAARRPAMA